MGGHGKTSVFIDGPATYATARALGFDIDYRKLLGHYRQTRDLLRISYYTRLADDQEFVAIRPLVDWLDYNGYRVVTRPAREFVDATGRRRYAGGMEVEITVDALDVAPHVGRVVLWTGNGDMCAMVDGLQRRGVRVEVVSTSRGGPGTAADELRRIADDFTELESLRPLVERTQDRPSR